MKYRRISSTFFLGLLMSSMCIMIILFFALGIATILTQSTPFLLLFSLVPIGFIALFLIFGKQLLRIVEFYEDKIVFRTIFGKVVKTAKIEDICSIHIEEEYIGRGGCLRSFVFDIPAEKKCMEPPFKLSYNRKNSAIIDELFVGRVPFSTPILLTKGELPERYCPPKKRMEKSIPAVEEQQCFLETDGWLFAILLLLEKGPFSLLRLISFDKLPDHSIPALEDINAGLSRLESEGFFATSNGNIVITKRGREFYKKHGKLIERLPKMQARYAKLFSGVPLTRPVTLKEYFDQKQYENVCQIYSQEK